MGLHSVKTGSRVMVLFLCTSSDSAVYLYKSSLINLKRNLRCGVKLYIFNGFKNDRLDTVVILKTSASIIARPVIVA